MADPIPAIESESAESCVALLLPSFDNIDKTDCASLVLPGRNLWSTIYALRLNGFGGFSR